MVRDEIMNPLFPLLKKVKQKLVCNGLKKERAGQVSRRKKASNAGLKSGNARRRKALSAELKPNSGATKGQLQPNTSIVVPNVPKEKKKTKKKKTDLTNQQQGWFNEFWAAYPRREGKVDALAKFCEVVKTQTLFDNLMIAALNYARKMSDQEREPRYMKLAATWLNKDRWHEDFEYHPPEQPKPNQKPKQNHHCLMCGRSLGDDSAVNGMHIEPCYGNHLDGAPHKFTTDGKPIADD